MTLYLHKINTKTLNNQVNVFWNKEKINRIPTYNAKYKTNNILYKWTHHIRCTHKLHHYLSTQNCRVGVWVSLSLPLSSYSTSRCHQVSCANNLQVYYTINKRVKGEWSDGIQQVGTIPDHEIYKLRYIKIVILKT